MLCHVTNALRNAHIEEGGRNGVFLRRRPMKRGRLDLFGGAVQKDGRTACICEIGDRGKHVLLPQRAVALLAFSLLPYTMKMK